MSSLGPRLSPCQHSAHHPSLFPPAATWSRHQSPLPQFSYFPLPHSIHLSCCSPAYLRSLIMFLTFQIPHLQPLVPPHITYSVSTSTLTHLTLSTFFSHSPYLPLTTTHQLLCPTSPHPLPSSGTHLSLNPLLTWFNYHLSAPASPLPPTYLY